MSELSVRETAARALEGHPTYGSLYSGSPDELRALTDVVLAAVADHDGLAGVLMAHRYVGFVDGPGPSVYGPVDEVCTCGLRVPDHVTHLADVVRTWLVQP